MTFWRGAAAPADARVAAPPGFVLVTRVGCHLCAVMAAELERELGAEGAGWSALDVDAEPGLRARFGEVVPVLLRDGLPVAKVRLEAGQLRRLRRRSR